MDNFKRFMTFSRGERIAIITIVSVIVIVLIAKYLIINNPPERTYFVHDLDSIVAKRNAVLDSIRVADSIEKGKACLATTGQKNNYTTNQQKQSKQKSKTTTQTTRTDKACLVPTDACIIPIIDINIADTTILKQLPGIGSTFASRFVSYREKLGGYYAPEQLLEVYGMDTTRYNKFAGQIIIDSSFSPNKLKINSDEFKVLLKHPYLEYDDVKKIVNHREQKGLITSWEQLTKIVGGEINQKLQYYIDYQ